MILKTILIFQEKEQKARERAEKEAAKNALKNVSPQEMFKTGDEAKKYSNWDGQGIPTHMADGQEVGFFELKFFLSVLSFCIFLLTFLLQKGLKVSTYF